MLQTESTLANAADRAEVDEKTARKVDFYTRQFVDAMAPSNFMMTNPEVLRATVDSGGENLVKGLEHMLDDLERGKGQLQTFLADLLRHAAHANASAAQLAAALRRIPGLRAFREVEANAVFVDLEPAVADAMAAKGWHFHLMGEAGYRLMCSWATRAADIERFVNDLGALIRSQRQ